MQKVLVFEAALLRSLGLFQGYSLEIERYLPKILDPKNNWFIDRDIAENDPKYKQVIPYVIIRFKRTFLTYVRGKRAREKRLVGLRSIALGGHIEPIDRLSISTNLDLYLSAARRELQEEVQIGTSYTERIVALINDDTTDVGRVHFGILHIWDVFEPIVTKREHEITKIGFVSLEKIKKMYGQFENWSKIAIDILDQYRE